MRHYFHKEIIMKQMTRLMFLLCMVLAVAAPAQAQLSDEAFEKAYSAKADIGPGGGSAIMRYKFQKGQVMRFIIDVRVLNKVVSGGPPLEIPITIYIAANYVVDSVTPQGQAAITMKITDMLMKADMAPVGDNFSYDSSVDKDPQDPAMKVLAALIGAPMTMKITPRGEISDMDLTEFEKALALTGDDAPPTFISQIMDQLKMRTFTVLPEAAIAAGQTYNAGDFSVAIPDLGQLDVSSKYEIVDVSGNGKKVLLKPGGNIKLVPTAGAAGDFKLNDAIIDGLLVFDVEKGFFEGGKSSLIQDITIKAQGVTLNLISETRTVVNAELSN